MQIYCYTRFAYMLWAHAFMYLLFSLWFSCDCFSMACIYSPTSCLYTLYLPWYRCSLHSLSYLYSLHSHNFKLCEWMLVQMNLWLQFAWTYGFSFILQLFPTIKWKIYSHNVKLGNIVSVSLAIDIAESGSDTIWGARAIDTS